MEGNILIQTTSTLYEKLYRSIATIDSSQSSQLVSVTTEIEEVKPLAFYQAGNTFKGERFYWSSADRSFTLVGIGEACKIESNEEGFQLTQKQWGELLNHAEIDNVTNASGTGPVAFGGFAFDPYKQASATWSDFPNSSTVVPRFLLTKSGTKYFITINALLSPEDSTDLYYQELVNQCTTLLEKEFEQSSEPQLIQQEEVAPEEWKRIVRETTEEIKAGKLGKVVLAREMIATFSSDIYIASLLNTLQEQQHQSYVFAYERGDSCFVGATPERLVKLEERELLSTCLAGTIARGETVEEDRYLGNQLLQDNKNLQEHEFVVNMIKAAVETCCHDVDVPDHPVLYPLRNLQHLYTPVRGKLYNGYTILDIVKQLHPTPALGGYPIKESIEFIREKEPFHRGWYASPIGWFDARDNGEFAVAIRSALITHNQAVLFSGCGIVEDSHPEAEYEETAIKFLPMLHALGGSQ